MKSDVRKKKHIVKEVSILTRTREESVPPKVRFIIGQMAIFVEIGTMINETWFEEI